MGKLFYKLFLAGFPLILITAFYLYTDPFMVLRKYPEGAILTHRHLDLNEDFDLTERFISDNPKAHYESFVFGDSKSAFFFGPKVDRLFENTPIFKYAVANESLYGITRKLQLIDKSGNHIKFAMINIDYLLLKAIENSHGHLFIKHPKLSGDGVLDFHLVNYLDLFNLDFIKGYSEELKKPYPLKPSLGKYETVESYIASNPDSFYANNSSDFYQRPDTQTVYPPIIGKKQLEMLDTIAAILQRHKTNYFIVIVPEYNQAKLAKSDLEQLNHLFDPSRIFNFSGPNKFNANVRNFFEVNHFRQFVAQQIIDSLYNRHLPNINGTY